MHRDGRDWLMGAIIDEIFIIADGHVILLVMRFALNACIKRHGGDGYDDATHAPAVPGVNSGICVKIYYARAVYS